MMETGRLLSRNFGAIPASHIQVGHLGVGYIQLCIPSLQCEAPKIAKLVYNSNNYGNYGTYNILKLYILTGAYKPTYYSGGLITSYCMLFFFFQWSSY